MLCRGSLQILAFGRYTNAGASTSCYCMQVHISLELELNTQDVILAHYTYRLHAVRSFNTSPPWDFCTSTSLFYDRRKLHLHGFASTVRFHWENFFSVGSSSLLFSLAENASEVCTKLISHSLTASVYFDNKQVLPMSLRRPSSILPSRNIIWKEQILKLFLCLWFWRVYCFETGLFWPPEVVCKKRNLIRSITIYHANERVQHKVALCR